MGEYNKFKNFLLVNWKDGFMVDKTHFEQLENYFINQDCEYRKSDLTRISYGLLPFRKEESMSGDFEIRDLITGVLEVRLKRCHAITPGGLLIDFNPAEDDELTATFPVPDDENLESTKQRWDVILTVDPFERIPCGVPDENEVIPRHPNAKPKYVLNILPAGQINAKNLERYHLIIGRVRRNGDRFEVDGNFIPPCTSVSSHPELKNYYLKFGKYIDLIEKACKAIISKVENMEKRTPLAENIEMICRNVIMYIANIYFSYRNEGQYYTPLRFLNVFSVLAHTCYVSLDFMHKNDKEEMMKYFYEWSDIKPGEFDAILKQNAGLLYDHEDIRHLMVTVEQFMYLFSQLLTTLSSLEYIGKHKENLVIAERSKSQSENKTEKWSLLE